MSVSDWVTLVHRFARLNSVVKGGHPRPEGIELLRDRILKMGIQISLEMAGKVYDAALPKPRPA
jgi:hypothetical protein